MLHANYSPALALVLAALLFQGHVGWGAWLCRRLPRLELPIVYPALSAIVGQGVFGLATLLVALASAATQARLIVLLHCLLSGGGAAAVEATRSSA
ncbi:MAG: hypothetical protein WDO73_36680 [Ignavibacteriota bacterium]